ncbi:hypothetical protein E2120_09975, partial [Escherichia coli]
GSPLHESTQQVENLRPDTACGLQAEKTGRFSLHRRDNTRPDKLRQHRIRHCAPTAGSGIPINAAPSPRLPVGWRGVSPSPTPAHSLPLTRRFSG